MLTGVPLHRTQTLDVPGGSPVSVDRFFAQCRKSHNAAGARPARGDGMAQKWRALDAVCGPLWRRPLLSREQCLQAAAVEPQLRPHVMHWTAGLGAWALPLADAAFLISLSDVLKQRAAGELAPDLSRAPRALARGSRAAPASSEAHTGTAAYDPTQSWLRRQRLRLHTYGVGGSGQQLRPRQLALLDRHVPEWDGKWQRMLEACRTYLRTKGKLPRDGPKQVAAVCHLGQGHSAADAGRGARASDPEVGGEEGSREPGTPQTDGAGACLDDGTAASQDRVAALAGWLTKQQQQLAEFTLSVERIAALDRTLGPQWRSYSPAQHAIPPDADPPVRVLFRLCEAARACGLPPATLTPVIEEYFVLATACRRVVRRKQLRPVPLQAGGGGPALAKWHHALRMLPEGPQERRLRTAVCHISAAPPPDTPGLPKTWQFVLNVAELADFWRAHQRHPSRAASAPLREQQLSKSVSRWLSLANSGQMPADRQMLLDSVMDDLRQQEIPAAWRESKRTHEQWTRWREHVLALRAHLAQHGRLPGSGEAAWWLQRMRWRKRSHKLKDLLWLDAALEGWDTLELPVRRRGRSATEVEDEGVPQPRRLRANRQLDEMRARKES